ncbi:MAG: hypothetical protein DDT24_00597 [Chloroflexi bacterium]|nr:hypothetical protein [Chloroflexota bacterium]MBT9166640.1 hypothetical protein [Chloroflexota bacterium]
MAKRTKHRISRAYMLRAYRSRNLGAEYLERGDYPSCIEFYQDSVEFSLKSILALYDKKFRLLHDVSEELVGLVESERFSDSEFREKTSVIVVGSRTLDSWRIPAIYGYPESDVPPKEIFDRRFAELAREFATEIFTHCKHLYSKSIYQDIEG